MITEVKGWKEVRNAMQSVLTRKHVFTVFKIKDIDPVSLEVVEGQNMKGTGSCTAVPTEEEVYEAWDKFEKLFHKEGEATKEPFYAVYDFGYYCPGNNYRSMLILFSYVPACQKGKVKMVYSTNVQAIKESMNIPYLIQADSLDAVDYNKIKESVSRIQITI
ncbi:hypothetical protein NUSPORA_00063 [Nucleospora cyclopteri]